MNNNGKPKVVYVRVGDAEHAEIRGEAAKRGLAISTFIRFVYRQWKELNTVGDAKPFQSNKE